MTENKHPGHYALGYLEAQIASCKRYLDGQTDRDRILITTACLDFAERMYASLSEYMERGE